MSNEMNQIRQRYHQAQGALNVALEIFGDGLAKKHKWKDLDGLPAIHYYLMQKHHWTPSQLRDMSHDDLRFALHEELQGWTLPKGAL